MSIRHISAVTLAVADMGRSCRFYRALGFTLKFGGENASFTSFHAGTGFVNLRADRTPPPGGGGLTIIHVDGVDALHARARDNGLAPEATPEDAPWGERYFHIRDPDGHCLSFATPLGGHGVPDDYPNGCVGVDGCPAGWVVATRTQLTVEPSLRAALDRLAPTIVAIDMPIGLSDDGRRACDVAARERLGPARASSVFAPPVRAALDAVDHGQASRVNRERSGQGLSVQAYHLIPKIAEIDALLAGQPQWRECVYEVHPELAFAAMNAGRPLADPKRSWVGGRTRLALLAARFGAGAFEGARATIPRREAADDDIADALACLFSAERIARDAHTTLPYKPPRDARGLAMRICY